MVLLSSSVSSLTESQRAFFVLLTEIFVPREVLLLFALGDRLRCAEVNLRV